MTAPRPSSTSGSRLAGRARRRAFGLALAACGVLALGLAMLGHRLSFVSTPSAASAAPLQLAPAAPSPPSTAVERAPADPLAAALVQPEPSAGTPTNRERAVPLASIGRTAPNVPVASAVAPALASAAPRRLSPAPSHAPSAPVIAPATPPRTGSDAQRPSAPLGQLQLTAEPAAWVELDAARVGRTPLMNHAASPGRHTLAFINPQLGERLETSVTVEPEGIMRVHADFTSANPRVIIR